MRLMTNNESTNIHTHKTQTKHECKGFGRTMEWRGLLLRLWDAAWMNLKFAMNVWKGIMRWRGGGPASEFMLAIFRGEILGESFVNTKEMQNEKDNSPSPSEAVHSFFFVSHIWGKKMDNVMVIRHNGFGGAMGGFGGGMISARHSSLSWGKV